MFLILSPFLTWITIVSVVVYQGYAVFGTAAQSNLIMISSQQLGTNISSTAALSALFSIALLMVGGAVMLRSVKAGLPISIAGLLAYLVPFYQMFGQTVSGLQYTFISPGIGFFGAAVGIGLGALSQVSRVESVRALVGGLRTKRGLSGLGVFVGVIALTLDFMNHLALGQAPDFIGSGVVEQAFHLGLVAGVTSLLVVVTLGKRVNRENWLFGISAATLLLLGADAGFNALNGSLQEFLGHNLTETILHISVYYGAAFVGVSNFLRKR